MIKYSHYTDHKYQSRISDRWIDKYHQIKLMHHHLAQYDDESYNFLYGSSPVPVFYHQGKLFWGTSDKCAL